MCHLDHHRTFPTKIIGCAIWILILLEAARTPNESNQRPQIQLSSTGKPVLVEQKEEHEIDFRVPGLSHAFAKEAEHLRVQELVKKIENHPHRKALQADLQLNYVYNPFSKNSKAMIRILGNVELF